MPSKKREVSVADRESATLAPVYGHLPFVPEHAEGCEIVTSDNRRILDLYGGHAVAALGYGHPVLTEAIAEQSRQLLFQSNAVALEIRASATERLLAAAPRNLTRAFFVNSGAEANEIALRIALTSTGRKKVLAITHGFHGRTTAAAAATWNSAGRWYGFPRTPFDVGFIPRDDVAAARSMITEDVAAVIFEPVQGIAGAYDLAADFVSALRERTAACKSVLIADEVQSGMGRSGQYFACQAYGIDPDILTNAKSLGGGMPCGVVLMTESLGGTLKVGDLGSTFGGGPVACAAILAVIDTIKKEALLANVCARESEIRDLCMTGPVNAIRGKGLLLGLVCNRPAVEVRDRLLQRDILTGLSSDPQVLRLLPPLVLQSSHVHQLAAELDEIGSLR